MLMSLSARLLVLTIFFVLLAEFLIYTPSIARFRKVYLEGRIDSAMLATLALGATPERMIGAELEKELLFHTGAYSISLSQSGRRMLMLSHDMPSSVDATFDLRKGDFMSWIGDAFQALVEDEDRILRVIGVSSQDPSVAVEVVLDEAPMIGAMHVYSANILGLSIVISLITAGLVYVSLQWLMVRPMGRITRSMTAFRENPEDGLRTIQPGGRQDEIGVAQRELAVMQNELRAALGQKSRLATLGAAVAKINHDLRNALSTAVLASDRLADIDDPEVKRLTPRLYQAIDRAVNLCSRTLNYVGDGIPRFKLTHFHLHELIAEAEADMRASEKEENAFQWQNTVEFEHDLVADREQLFRVLNNLAQNARQAGATNISVSASRDAERLIIDVADDGPGLSPRARERLFQPFAGSARDGGTGLGLVIARDIMRAHGGDIQLAESGEKGTTFRLELPVRGRA